MKKALLLFLLLFLIRFFCLGQSTELSKLKSSLGQLKDSLQYVDVLNRMAMLLYEKNVDSTFYYTIKARAIADRLSYEKGKADATNNLGIFFDIKGNLQLALRYYNDAHISYVKLKDSSNQVQAMMNIGMVYKEIGKNSKAIERYNAILDFGKKLRKDSIMSLVIYNYLLQFPLRFNKPERAKLISEARQIANHYKDKRTLLAIDQLIADDMIANGQRTDGLALLDSTISSTINNKLYYVSMDMLIDMGDQLLLTNPKKAANYYQQGLEIANKNGYLIYSKLMAKKLFDFYASQNNHALATKYGQQLIIAIQKQEELDNHSGVDYLDYAIKDQQIQTLVTRSNYQTVLLVLSIIVCALAIAIILFIRQNLRRSKSVNKLISEQNSLMKKTLSALEQSQADNARMMKIAAHDLRNPIGGMCALASLMLAEPGRSEEDKEMLEIIKQSGQNSLELVKDLLEVQFNTIDFEKEILDISEILSYCVTLLQNKAELKKQHIQLHSFEFKLVANREKLWRVFSNLISNAIKFSPFAAIIKISISVDEQGVVVSIQDDGIGIPIEMKDKIFDMFTDAKRLGTAGEEPIGLGLFISKQIVEAHHGKIWCSSVPGKGSTFFVKLPITAAVV